MRHIERAESGEELVVKRGVAQQRRMRNNLKRRVRRELCRGRRRRPINRHRRRAGRRPRRGPRRRGTCARPARGVAPRRCRARTAAAEGLNNKLLLNACTRIAKRRGVGPDAARRLPHAGLAHCRYSRRGVAARRCRVAPARSARRRAVRRKTHRRNGRGVSRKAAGKVEVVRDDCSRRRYSVCLDSAKSHFDNR